MANIIFWILVYLIAGCAYSLMVWCLFKDGILEDWDQVAREYGVPKINTVMMILNMIETIIIWPYFWGRFMYNIVKNV